MTEAARPVLVLGDAAVDWLVRVAALPPRGGNAWSVPPVLTPGGSAANVAVGLTRLGVPVRFQSKVGDDAHGRFVLDDLAREGVATDLVSVDPSSFTPVVLAILDAAGERTLISCSRDSSQAHQTVSELDATLLGRARWLHTSGISLAERPSRDTILAGMAIAQTAGVPISFDLNLRLDAAELAPEAADVTWRAIELSDLVFASAAEARSLLGDRESRAEAVLERFSDARRTGVLRIGAGGAVARSRDGQTVRVASRMVPIVDALGAGDAFDAGYLAGWLETGETASALRWGNAAAAISLGRAGARSCPSLAELRAALEASTPR